MPKPDKIEKGHYTHRGIDIIHQTTSEDWDIIRDPDKVTEKKLATFSRLKDCVDWLDREKPDQEKPKPKLNSGKGRPVFVITDSFLDQMSAMGEKEYYDARAFFKEVVKDEQNRIRLIFLALVRRKIEQLEKMDMFAMKVEELIGANIEHYSPEQLMEFYEAISKRLESEGTEIGRIINSL